MNITEFLRTRLVHPSGREMYADEMALQFVVMDGEQELYRGGDYDRALNILQTGFPALPLNGRGK